jgi:hypothetical protein
MKLKGKQTFLGVFRADKSRPGQYVEALVGRGHSVSGALPKRGNKWGYYVYAATKPIKHWGFTLARLPKGLFCLLSSDLEHDQSETLKKTLKQSDRQMN